MSWRGSESATASKTNPCERVSSRAEVREGIHGQHCGPYQIEALSSDDIGDVTLKGKVKHEIAAATNVVLSMNPWSSPKVAEPYARTNVMKM
jgi:hypothetical protein